MTPSVHISQKVAGTPAATCPNKPDVAPAVVATSGQSAFPAKFALGNHPSAKFTLGSRPNAKWALGGRPSSSWHCFLTAAVAVFVAMCIFLTSCSDTDADDSLSDNNNSVEPEFGYTGFDKAGFLPASLLANDRSIAQAEATSRQHSSSSIASDGGEQNGSSAQSATSGQLLGIAAEDAVIWLHQLGYSSQQLCQARLLVDDFALPQDKTQAIVTPQNAARTAEDVEDAVWNYFQVVAQTFREPFLQKLLCLARVATLPKLEWKWKDLQGLVRGQTSVTFLQPTEVHVVGLLTGSAIAVACLPPLAYGELAADNQEIATSLLLRWAGGKWRVSVTQDFPGEQCRELASRLKQEYENDISTTGQSWILSDF